MNRGQKEQASTYIVYDRHHKEEVQRLAIQDQLITAAMEEVLAMQVDPAIFRVVLDIGCGTGGWMIEMAKRYPDMTLLGIDISAQMINFAREQAALERVSARVTFQEMDALRKIDTPTDFFDLVNLRFGLSFIRTWEWLKLIGEMLRVTRPGGVLRIIETSILHQSNSPALQRFQEICLQGMQRAGYLRKPDPSGMTLQLAPLLRHFGVKEIQATPHTLVFQAGTEACRTYIADVQHAMHTLQPFLQRWGCAGEEYEEICQKASEEIVRPDFYAAWDVVAVWGVK